MILSSSLGHLLPSLHSSLPHPSSYDRGGKVQSGPFQMQQSPSYLQENPLPQPYLEMVMSSFSFIKCKEHLTAWEAK